MSSLAVLKKRMNISGNTARQERVQFSRAMTDELLPEDPSYKQNIEILNKGFTSLRMWDYRLLEGSTPNMDVQQSLSEKVLFRLGDIFHFENSYWICTKTFNYHDIYLDGQIEECNFLLTWQNPATFEIHSRWCSVRDPYSYGIDDNYRVNTGNGRYKVKIPYDDETRLFFADKRFLMNIANNEAIPYRLIKFDDVTNRYLARQEGFLIINLIQDELRDGDNKELMVADYIEPPPPAPAPIQGKCEIQYIGNAITGDAVVKAGGSAKKFTAVFYDNADNILTGVSPFWNLILDTDLAGKITISSQEGNDIKLIAVNDDLIIGKTFKLKLSAADAVYGVFEYDLEIEVGEFF